MSSFGSFLRSAFSKVFSSWLPIFLSLLTNFDLKDDDLCTSVLATLTTNVSKGSIATSIVLVNIGFKVEGGENQATG